MTDENKIKEVATKIAIEVITNAANEDLSGEEKEARVCEFLAKLDDNLPIANFIPNSLEAEILDAGLDKIQEFFTNIDIKSFVKKHYQRIKSVLKKVFHKN